MIATDIVMRVSAQEPDSYKFGTLASYGENRYSWEWGGSSGRPIIPGAFPVYGADGILRAGVVADPIGGVPQDCFEFCISASDPDTSGVGNKRSELALGWTEYSYPGKVAQRVVAIPHNREFWWSIRLAMDDFRSTNDRQVICQWLSSDSGSAGPMMALDVYGATLRLEVHSDASSPPSSTTMVKRIPWSMTWEPNRWYTITMLARIDDTAPAEGFLELWVDGAYQLRIPGPIGYSGSSDLEHDYVKFGLYHWTVGNSWDASVPYRRMWVAQAALVLHDGSYTPSMIEALQ